MEDILNEKYIKLLELVERIDKKLVDKISLIIKSFPKPVKRYLKNEQSCSINSTESTIDINICNDIIDLQYIKYKNYSNTNIFIKPFYEDELTTDFEEFVEDLDLSDEDFEDDDFEEDFHHLLLCSLTQTNTEEKCSLKFYYNQNGKNYDLKKVENTPNNGKELDISVYLDKIDEEFYLTCVRTFNGVELSSTTKKIDYSDLLEFAIEENNNFNEDI